MSRQLLLALFLGAGASVPYGKPTTRKLKDELVIKYKRDGLAQRNQAEHYFKIWAKPRLTVDLLSLCPLFYQAAFQLVRFFAVLETGQLQLHDIVDLDFQNPH